MSATIAEGELTLSEAAVRRLWASHSLPPATGTLGRGSGPVLRQLIGTYTPGDTPVTTAHRAVAADVDARATALAAGRAFGTLRREGWPGETPDPVVAPLLESLGIWTGGSDGRPYDAEPRTEGVQAIASRLARLGAFVSRDGPVRLCPSCAAPRSPERTIYHEEVGDTFLVRFPLEAAEGAPPVEALAWVDSPWRLLGATALLVSPDLSYATVEYRRGDLTARLLTLRSSLGRLKAWLPGAEFTVVEEHPGREYVGRRYVYPLRHEFPDGASLTAPSGTVQAVAEVGDSGTGVVPLVPGHGGSDAHIADRLGIHGWPLLTLKGTLDLTLMHKYSGLDLETANEFVARDLTEAGSVLARLRVLRGVPYCGVCGRPVVWFPGRCWCLEPGRLPADQLARYSQILPNDRPISEIEVTAWPVSETRSSDAPEAVTLLECDRCNRLEAPEGPTRCPCGGSRRPVARRLTPAVAGAFAAWARNDPIPPGDPVRLYLSQRRRAPAVVHHLAAMAAVEAAGAEVSATVLPTVSDVDLVGLVREHGADAVRAAFVRTGASEGPGGSFTERCRQERRRFARLQALATAVVVSGDRGSGPSGVAGATPTDRDLEAEDRALLARWAATELQVFAAYDELRPADAHRRVTHFIEVDLGHYLALVRGRESGSAPLATRRAEARTLGTVLSSIAVALAPIAPFTAEGIVRTLRPEPRSLFETDPFDVERPPPDEGLAEAWDSWLAVVRAVERFRSEHKLPPGSVVPSVTVVVADDALGDRLRGDRAVVERLAGIARFEVGSPRTPWEGRRRQLVPVEAEIQRSYPAIATQIVHLLRRMPPRRAGEAESARGFSVFVQGQPHQITPQMLAVVESLPERVVPTPFALGEMFAEVPAGAKGAGGLAPLTADAAWLVRRISRRLRLLPPETARSLHVRVLAVDPLARELREQWSTIATALGVATLEIAAPSPTEGGAPAALVGRTRLGARWSVEIPGLERGPRGRRRAVVRSAGAGVRRMPLRRPPLTTQPPEIDYTDERVIHHEDDVRALGEQLDQLLDAPLLGPAKVNLAWQAGYTTLNDLRAASFDELATLPGFGRPVASRLFTKLGRAVPPPLPRARVAPRPRRTPAPVAPSPPPTPPPEPVVAVPPTVPEPVAALPPPVPEPVPLPRAPPPPPRPAPAPRPPPPPLEAAFVAEAERPVAEEPPPAPPVPVGLEVELSPSLLPALQPFLDATAAGHRGLAVVRELPERIRTLVGPRPVAVYWLSNLARDRTVRPDDLPGLTALVRKAVETNGITAIFLEGVEYLTRIHGTDAVIAFLREVDGVVRGHEARAWLHLTPGLLSPSDLERMTTTLHEPASHGEEEPLVETTAPPPVELPRPPEVAPSSGPGPPPEVPTPAGGVQAPAEPPSPPNENPPPPVEAVKAQEAAAPVGGSPASEPPPGPEAARTPAEPPSTPDVNPPTAVVDSPASAPEPSAPQPSIASEEPPLEAAVPPGGALQSDGSSTPEEPSPAEGDRTLAEPPSQPDGQSPSPVGEAPPLAEEPPAPEPAIAPEEPPRENAVPPDVAPPSDGGSGLEPPPPAEGDRTAAEPPSPQDENPSPPVAEAPLSAPEPEAPAPEPEALEPEPEAPAPEPEPPAPEPETSPPEPETPASEPEAQATGSSPSGERASPPAAKPPPTEPPTPPEDTASGDGDPPEG